MINEEVRHIIEAEPIEGEALLWAEKIDDNLRMVWVNKSALEAKIYTIPFFLLGGFIIWITVSIDRHPDANLWIVGFASLLPILIGCLFLYASFLSLKSFFGTDHIQNQRPYELYALTNLRLLYFDGSNSLIVELNAKHLKRVELFKRWYFPNKWKSLCLMMSPIGEGLWKMSELYFLPDFEKAKKQILSVVNAKD